MNVNYDNLVVYHCKNNHDYSLEFIKYIIDYIDKDGLLLNAAIYNNVEITKFALSLNISGITKDKVFIKSCNLKLLDIAKLYNKYNNFKYKFIVLNDVIQGNINIVAKIKNIYFDNDCCICLEKAECKTSCNHDLCVKCFKNSYRTTGNCPMCRKEIDFCYIGEKTEL